MKEQIDEYLLSNYEGIKKSIEEGKISWSALGKLFDVNKDYIRNRRRRNHEKFFNEYSNGFVGQSDLNSSWVGEHLKDNGINPSLVKTGYYKKVPKDGEDGFTVFFRVGEGDNQVDYTEEFNKVVSDYQNILSDTVKSTLGKGVLVIVLSDLHIGMDARGQYSYEYTEEVIKKNLQKVVDDVMEKRTRNGSFEKIVLLDLGDGLDGYRSQTTRGGHHLPQLYSTPEMFRIYVQAKISLIQLLYSMCKELVVRNVCNDNHAGDFAMIANMAVAIATPEVNHANYDKFLNSLVIGNNCFIITHGKDKDDMKFGLTLNPNDKVINYLNNYIQTNGLEKYNVVVLKGDLHQFASHKNKFFAYHNFASFAPPSKRVQNNFQDSVSGYSLLVVSDDKIERTDHYIEYERNIQPLDIIH